MARFGTYASRRVLNSRIRNWGRLARAWARPRAAVMAFAAGLACQAAAVAGPPVIVPIPGMELPAPESEPAVVRQVAATAHLGHLPEPGAAVGQEVALELFPDLRVAGVITSVEHGASGAVIYRGRIDGRPGGSFALARAEDVLVGEVRLGLAGLFEIRVMPGAENAAGGAHVVRQIDESRLPPCATGPEHAVISPAEDPAPADGERGQMYVFDVLVLYTPQARDGAGGRAAMEALIDLGVSNTNLSYANSGIPAEVKVVYRGVVPYTETGLSDTELSRFRSASDGYMDSVHCLRDAYGADLCSLIVDSFDACGIGYLMANPSPGFASSAFSVTARGCLSSYTFAHELGHNQGSHHDRDNASSTPAYPYSYGWRTPGDLYRTVMSYAPGTRIPYFSNPDVTYQGFVLGSPQGQANAADNARSIRNTAPIVSQFRSAYSNLNRVERLSISSTGEQANAASGTGRLAVSDSGAVVAFESLATNLDSADTNAAGDVYVHDRTSGLTRVESVRSGTGVTAAGGTGVSISGDGRRLVFSSESSTLVTGDTNGVQDVFLRDRISRTTTRLSVGAGGVQANGPSGGAVIARSALVAAFVSSATNLAPGGGGGGRTDVYVRDITAGSTVLVSRGLGGASADGSSARPDISANGRFIAFESVATNLVPGDTNGVSDIFVYDRQTGQTVRVSVSGLGEEANGGSYNPRISADGRFVAFESDATNLAGPDGNNARDVFLHDRQTGATRRVSVSDTGRELVDGSSLQGISADGRFVAFITTSHNVGPVDTNTHADLYIRDAAARRTRRASTGWLNQQLNGPVLGAAISADGRYAVMSTTAVNAVPCDGNSTNADVVLVDLGAPEPAPCAGDFNADGLVSSTDISLFLTVWLASIDGTTYGGDFDGDGRVTSTDISAFLTAWLASIGGC